MFNLILNEAQYPIPMNFPSLYKINPNISSELTMTMKYQIKSSVSGEVLQSFIDFWVDEEVPTIFNENFHQYEQLSKEFCYMKDIIQEFNYCKKANEIKIVDNYIKYLLDEKQMTASIIDNTTLYVNNNLTEPIVLFIPRSITYNGQEYIINRIEKDSFKLAKKIKAIQFANDSVISVIDSNAFAYSELEYILIPSCVQEIGENVFKGCHKLKRVDIDYDSQLKEINKSMFLESSIESLYIPSSIIEIKEGWCFRTKNLVEIKVSPNNTRINYVHNDFLISVNESGEYVLIFARRNIDKAKIPSFTRRIAAHAFDNCKMLKSVQFATNASLEIIDMHAFSFSSLEVICIPSHVKMICDNAFEECRQLKQVIFTGDSELEFIGTKAFFESSIESIEIPQHVKCIGNLAFSYSALREIKFHENSELEVISGFAFANTQLERIMIPAHVSRLCNDVFNECRKLKIVEFPLNSQLKSIEESVFYNSAIECLSLPSSVIEINEKWCNGVEFLKNIVVFPNGAQNIVCYDNSFIIGKSVINSNNFDVFLFARRDIPSIAIPPQIATISSYCFENCKMLENVIFSDDSQLSYIGELSFSKTSIHEIVIPRHVSSICMSAFAKCFQLHNVTFMNDSELKIIHFNAFSKCSISGIVIPSSVDYIDDEAFFQCSELEMVAFEENSRMRHIGKKAFSECKKLQRFDFPKNEYFHFVLDSLFFDSSINHLRIPSNVISLNEGWCKGTPNLTNFEIEQGNPSFANYNNIYILGKSNQSNNYYDILFFARRDIEIAVIPPFIRVIAPYAFDNCNNLRNVEIAENSDLRIIDRYAFFRCSLDNILIPQSVTEIRMYAFSQCRNLQIVRCNKKEDQISIDDTAFWFSNVENVFFA